MALGLRAHKRPSKGRQKSITRLARNSPAVGWVEAKGQEAVPGDRREASARGPRVPRGAAGCREGL